MKKKKLIPKSLKIAQHILVGLAMAIIAIAIGVCIGSMFSSCTQESKANVTYDNALSSQLEEAHNIIYGYNALLHRIWIDKPNYFEDCLVETDEWMSLDSMVDGDFTGAFDFWSEEDSVAYHMNWENGDNTIKVVKYVPSN